VGYIDLNEAKGLILRGATRTSLVIFFQGVLHPRMYHRLQIVAPWLEIEADCRSLLAREVWGNFIPPPYIARFHDASARATTVNPE
jgi:hypothetical protein